ncbi:hypothetical protein [Actinomadura luteofluorescens]|uniref:hypothetical protein n=1 Tax=Actinomadura luteofluorescens TaxID=46163 RepID=UPI003D8BB45F
MAVYERGVAGHVAERVQPEPDSGEAARLQALADDPASDWRRVDDPAPAEQPEPSRPAKSAAKGAWVEWAVSQGADRAEAEKATKDDLIAAYGGEGDDPNGGGE